MNEFRKTNRTVEETAKLKSDRERYQREKPTPEQLLAEGGHKDFVTIGKLMSNHEKVCSLITHDTVRVDSFTQTVNNSTFDYIIYKCQSCHKEIVLCKLRVQEIEKEFT